MPTLGPDQLIKARKKHRCHLCGLRIRKGATYYLREGAEGTEHWRVRMHAVCRNVSSGWDDDDWMCHNEWDFRQYDLDLTPAGLLGLMMEIFKRKKK
jgi:hypothetical protein